MNFPAWYALLLLALAAWRTWVLLGRDTVLEPLREWLGARSQRLLAFLECPYCAGFWIALAWWGLWDAWPHATTVAAAALAITGLVPLIERLSSGGDA